MTGRRELKGQVALVAGGGEGAGRAVALALAARGVRVMVIGPVERVLGNVVGEIVCGGGKARHLAGDLANDGFVLAAIARALDVFGGLDIAVGSALPSTRVAGGVEAVVVVDDVAEPGLGATARLFRMALPRMGLGRKFLLTSAPSDLDADLEVVGELAVSLCASEPEATRHDTPISGT